MQLLLNNWAATLQAPATSGDPTLRVELERAAELVGLDGSNYYLLTLANGTETAWEIVKVTAVDDDELTVEWEQEGTGPLAWPEGTLISLRLTAGPVQRAFAQAGIARSNMLARLEAGWAGMAPALFWAAQDVGAYARHQPGLEFAWASLTDFAALELLDLQDGYANIYGEGLGISLFRLPGGTGLGLGTGSTEAGSLALGVSPAEPAGFAELEPFELAQLAEVDVRLMLRRPSAATEEEDFLIEVSLGVPGIGNVTLRQGLGNMTYHYQAGGDEYSGTAGFALGTFDTVLCVHVLPEDDDYRIDLATRTSWGEPTTTVFASWLASDMDVDTAALGYNVSVTKIAGTAARVVQVKRYGAFARLA